MVGYGDFTVADAEVLLTFALIVVDEQSFSAFVKRSMQDRPKTRNQNHNYDENGNEIQNEDYDRNENQDQSERVIFQNETILNFL